MTHAPQGTYDVGYSEWGEEIQLLTIAGEDSHIPASLREEIRAAICGYDGHPRVSIVDDRGEPVQTANRTDCAILDVTCADGSVIRVGYYHDGATTVVDLVGPECDDCEQWAGEWDADGLVPVYLGLGAAK